MLVSIPGYLIYFFAIFSLVLGDDYCFMNDSHSYTNFATKTAYENIRGNDVYIIPGNILLYLLSPLSFQKFIF